MSPIASGRLSLSVEKLETLVQPLKQGTVVKKDKEQKPGEGRRKKFRGSLRSS